MTFQDYIFVNAHEIFEVAIIGPQYKATKFQEHSIIDSIPLAIILLTRFSRESENGCTEFKLVIKPQSDQIVSDRGSSFFVVYTPYCSSLFSI